MINKYVPMIPIINYQRELFFFIGKNCNSISLDEQKRMLLSRSFKLFNNHSKSIFLNGTCNSFSTAIMFEKTGVPSEVLSTKEIKIAKVGSSQIGLKMLAAPLNTSDFNMIEGTYGIKAKLPSVGGNEGVAIVTEVGPNVKDLQINDWVIPASPGFGTWRENHVVESKEVLKVPNDIPAVYASTIAVNPATAYRLLRDFATLKPGDYIMQNGANSMVGLAVIQMAREMNIKTINIVRDRPDVSETLELLSNYGGNINVPSSYVGTPGFKEILAELPDIKLGFNCVGGDIVVDMARSLTTGATIVTYGGMSKKPVEIPNDILTNKKLNLQGFWVSEWNEKAKKEERSAMLEDIANMIKSKKLSFLYEMHDFDDFNYAMKRHYTDYKLRKVVLNMDYPDRLAEHDALDEADYYAFDAPRY